MVLDQRGTVFSSPVIGLDEKVLDLPEPSGQFGLIGDLAGAEFQDLRRAAGLECQQVFLLTGAADEGAVGHHVLFVQVHPVIELCLDLEQVPEILVIGGGEEAVDALVSGHDDLQVQGHRLRPESLGNEEPGLLGGVLQPRFLVADGPLQAFPGARRHQNVPCVQHQITAVGQMNSTGFQHAMVADVGPHHGPAFYSAK